MPGKRTRGRPKLRWLDNITNDLSERALSGEEARKTEFNGYIYHKKFNIDPAQRYVKHPEEKDCCLRVLLYIIIQNIFTNLNCDKNKDFL